jgi:hypothetical protein
MVNFIKQNHKFMKFNTHFKQSINDIAFIFGLEFVSLSKRQRDNGTLVFYDDVTECLYAVYESGYVRRFIKVSEKKWMGYQLNRTLKLDKQQIRILAQTPEEILGLMIIGVINYRMTCANRHAMSGWIYTGSNPVLTTKN